MTTNFIIFICAAVILIGASFVARSKMSGTKYYFNDWEKVDMPYITIDVQGKPLNFITDSGAAVSVISKEILSELNYEPSIRKVNLTALNNEGVDSEMIVLAINIGGKEVKSDFLAYEGVDIAGFGSKHGVPIDGILGVEFFKKTGGKIDFNKKTVTFP